MNTQEKHTHTPGPWRQGMPHGACMANIYGPGYLQIAEASAFGCEDERGANARLIAAAPELLAALEAMLRVALKCDDKAWAMAVERSDETRPCDMALEAIAKARGERG